MPMSTNSNHSRGRHDRPEAEGDGTRTDLAAVFSDRKVAEGLRQASSTTYDAAASFWRAAHSARALSPRMKELVLVALHGSVTALDAEAVRRHVGRALAAGATPQDVLDVLITIAGVA